GVAKPLLAVCRSGRRADCHAVVSGSQERAAAGRALHAGRTRVPFPFTKPSDGSPLDTAASGTVLRASERRGVHRKGCERDHPPVSRAVFALGVAVRHALYPIGWIRRLYPAVGGTELAGGDEPV